MRMHIWRSKCLLFLLDRSTSRQKSYFMNRLPLPHRSWRLCVLKGRSFKVHIGYYESLNDEWWCLICSIKPCIFRTVGNCYYQNQIMRSDMSSTLKVEDILHGKMEPWGLLFIRSPLIRFWSRERKNGSVSNYALPSFLAWLVIRQQAQVVFQE